MGTMKVAMDRDLTAQLISILIATVNVLCALKLVQKAKSLHCQQVSTAFCVITARISSSFPSKGLGHQLYYIMQIVALPNGSKNTIPFVKVMERRMERSAQRGLGSRRSDHMS